MKWSTVIPAMIISLLAATTGSAQVPDNAVWIDVRSPGEFDQGHLEQATNIPWDGISAGIQALGLESDRPIYLYCGSGKRAERALQQLQRDGYSQVINAGGLEQAREMVAAE